MDWKERYRAAHRLHFARKYPMAMSTGYFTANMPNVNKANGLTTFIVNFCNWMGHDDVYRQNTMGRYLEGKKHKTNIYAGGQIQEKGFWIKSEKGKGWADVTGGIRGRRINFEIKIGKDSPSKAQLERQEKARADNSIYEFISTPEDFLIIYDKIISGLI
jgi:hypothetical protein